VSFFFFFAVGEGGVFWCGSLFVWFSWGFCVFWWVCFCGFFFFFLLWLVVSVSD